jgi:hypothetical protein
MRARIWAIFLGGALSCVAVACGDSESDGAGDKDEFVAQLCAELAPCCEAAGRPADGAQCRAFYGAFASASSYDPVAAEACLNEVRAMSDRCDTSSFSPSCNQVFASGGGSKKPGEACDDDSDCAPPEAGRVECVSDFVDGASVQQCQVRLVGQAGSTPCVGTIDGNVTSYFGADEGIPPTGYTCDLADGLSCNSQTGACESLAAVGEPCSSGLYRCVSSAYCSFPDSICTARVALGDACTDDDQCAESAYCEPSGSTCASRRPKGEACTSNAECESNDCTNQKCAVGNDLGLALVCGSL